MDHNIMIFSTKEHQDTIKMLKLQLKNLEDMAEEIKQQILDPNTNPVLKVNMQLQLLQYNQAKQQVENKVKEFDLKRQEALN